MRNKDDYTNKRAGFEAKAETTERKAQYYDSKYRKGVLVSRELRIAQEQLEESYDNCIKSIDDAVVLQRYLEGEHYADATLKDIRKAKRVPDKYNLLLRITNLLNGYFAKTVTDVIASAVKLSDNAGAVVHNENWKYTKRVSDWDNIKEQVISDLIEAGQGCLKIEVEDTGQFDELSRPIRRILMDYVPFDRVYKDPKDISRDGSKATYINHIEYLTFEDIEGRWGLEIAEQIEELGGSSYGNDKLDSNVFTEWREGNEYAVVATHSKDSEGRVKIIHWYEDIEIEITTLAVQMYPIIAIPLKISKLDDRYYTPLTQCIHTQDSINQALLKWQEMLDNKLIIADKKAVKAKDLPSLQLKAKTVGEILHVDNINGIDVINLTSEAQAHLNKLYTAIQFMLDTVGINEAFLGQSKAGDSGRKFEGQVAQSENTLNYIFRPINTIYRVSFYTTAHYCSVYKQATEQLRFVDDFNKERWQYINIPFLSTDMDGKHSPVEMLVKNSKGKLEKGYLNDHALALRDIQMEVEVHTAPYDDTDAVESAFLESMLNGIGGQAMMNASPSSLFYTYQLLSGNLRTRNSEKISKMFQTISQQLGALPIDDPRIYEQQGGGQAQQNGGSGIQGVAGTQNDNQPAGYNKPTGGGEPNQGGQ